MGTKYRQKRTKPIEKIWYILQPFLVYMVVKTVAMICLSPFHEVLYTSLINAIASLCGVAFVMRDFLIEVAVTGEVDIDGNAVRHFFSWIKNGLPLMKAKWLSLCLTALLAVTSGLTFNILVSLLQIHSGKYDSVEEIQYAVPFWLGLLLYCVISPWVEEIVFRGLVFNRMKHYYRLVPSILISSLMFGGFHGNLPQILYGTCMGILMCLCYVWMKSFCAPLLFHTVANLFIYLTSTCGVDSQILARPGFCVLFFVFSLGLLGVIWLLEAK